MLRDLEERRLRTEKIMARFRARPFSWAERRTCIHLARAQMTAFGHRPPSLPDIRSAIGARRALKATGHADLAALLDSLLPRIAPAAMWLGDLALMQGGDGFDAIVINAGGKVLGYHDAHLDKGLVAIVPAEATCLLAAWRL